MKRVKAACICQTLHFSLKDEAPREITEKFAKEEFESYKKSLEKSKTLYKILEETVEEDGSLTVKVIKQYNTSPVGSYLD